ncbi:MAG: hypothetical protein WEA09_06760 [Gemmatimonadota bacterium]
MTLCLWLPTFELRLELVRSPELDATSVALLDPAGGQRPRIWQLSARAAEAGVQPGMLISRAVALCPALTLLEPDPTHYETAFQEMLEALEDISPLLEPGEPGRVFLGMEGLERVHGPPQRQMTLALERLLEIFPPALAASTRAGWAPGTFGARVAAAAARPGAPVHVPDAQLPTFLAPRSVSLLPVSTSLMERLGRLGVSTLGELGRLPEEALVAQFGEEGRQARRWALGERRDPVRPRHRPRPIRVTLDLPAPTGQEAVLHAALDRLLDRALSRPARRGRSIGGIRLNGRLEGGGSWQVEVVLREPSALRNRLVFPLRNRIGLNPPPRAVESLGVEFFAFGPASTQTDLFAPGHGTERKSAGMNGEASYEKGGPYHISGPLGSAVRELTLKLGVSPLYRVVEVDPWSRIPERRNALLKLEP